MTMDPTYPLYSICAFVSFVIVLIPLPWHLQAWNVGTCSYMIWTAIACLNQFVNSIVWKDNAINWAPVWCDISSRIIIATSVAIPAASLSITRRLYKISRVQAVVASQKERRREMAIDLSLVVGLPVLVMILYFFVQGHRFDIFEEMGCFPVTLNTPPSYFLVWMWPLLLGLISMVYCVLTVSTFLKRRREMSQFLSSNSQITFSRYFRLMVLAMMDTFLTVPLASFAIWLNAVESTISPWHGLADAHFDFSAVDQIPAVLWRLSKWTVLSFYLDRWFIIFCAAVFFAFFGFAEESRKNYYKIYWTIAKRFGYYPASRSHTHTSLSACRTPRLPTMSSSRGIDITKKGTHEKRGSFISSVDGLSTSFTVDTIYGEHKLASSEDISLSPVDVVFKDDDDLAARRHSTLPVLPMISVEKPLPTRPPRPASLGDMV
ncbi:pheromone A receptor-domain-containing protein [Phellopilus nigrolimitatus]|nr:pheromone A receptor-domain-containing protein [Phellopilus nigrolimitatus]